MDKIIFPYIRFSKKQQKKGASLQRQIERINDYAERNNFKIDNHLKLRDLGKSAFTGENSKNGALGRFLFAIEKELVPTDGSAYLCVEQMDRLSRQEIDDASDLFKKILRKNVNIITLMDNKIYTKDSLNKAIDIMYSLILMEQAHVESAKKSERILNVFDTRLTKIEEGKKIQFAGMLPGWIDNVGDKNNRKFMINEHGKTVRLIFKMYYEGSSLSDITKYLDDNNYPQVAKKRHKNFTNRWSSGKVSHLLSNRCVLGELYIKRTDTLIEKYYPPVIPLGLFEEVEAKRSNKRKAKRSGRKSINIFTGKLFCGECGQKIYFETDDKKTKTNHYKYHMLKCSARRFKGCNSKSVRYEDFLKSSPNFFFLNHEDNPYSKYKTDERTKIIQELKAEVRKKGKKLTDLEEAYDKDDSVDVSVFLKASSKIKKDIEKIKARIADLQLQNSRSRRTIHIDDFDLNNLEHIAKAKEKIDQIYAGFILFPTNSLYIEIRHNGEFRLNIIESNDQEPFEYYIEFIDLIDNLKKEYEKGTLDGKFIDIINAVNLWGIETPERISSLNLPKMIKSHRLQEIHENEVMLDYTQEIIGKVNALRKGKK